MDKKDQRLVWIDLEMTGLDPLQHVIIEIATIVTDSELNIIAEGPVIAVHQADAALDAMDEWCTNTHGASGLTRRVRDSQVSLAEAEQQTIAFLQQYIGAGVSPICGNSVGQDRRFLDQHMPTLEAFFHYRTIDVSTLKELMLRWRPDLRKGFKKAGTHLALDDIRESIAELRYYREHFLRVNHSV